MFENQMKKKRPARNGEPAAGELLVRDVAAGDVVAGQVVGELDRHLHLVRLALHPAWRSKVIAPIVSDAGEQQVEDGLVDRESMPPMSIEIQGSSRNSFCGWNASFLPSLPRISSSAIEDREVERREPMRTFALVLIAPASSSA